MSGSTRLRSAVCTWMLQRSKTLLRHASLACNALVPNMFSLGPVPAFLLPPGQAVQWSLEPAVPGQAQMPRHFPACECGGSTFNFKVACAWNAEGIPRAILPAYPLWPLVFCAFRFWCIDIQGLNCRFSHCFRQEDWNILVCRIASRCHKNTLELGVLQSVYLKLRFGADESTEGEESDDSL